MTGAYGPRPDDPPLVAYARGYLLGRRAAIAAAIAAATPDPTPATPTASPPAWPSSPGRHRTDRGRHPHRPAATADAAAARPGRQLRRGPARRGPHRAMQAFIGHAGDDP
jgi:hypothetical protein